MFLELADRLAQALGDRGVQCAAMPCCLVTEGEHDPGLVGVVGHTGVPCADVPEDQAAFFQTGIAGRSDLVSGFNSFSFYADDARDDVVVF